MSKGLFFLGGAFPLCYANRLLENGFYFYFVCFFALQDIVTMQLCANKLDKKDFFGKSDPFLVFYRSNEDGT